MDLVAIENFDDARHLSEAELRELVNAGDPRSRAYAVWALGLRSASVVTHLEGEPDPGVRRALAVVLASQGELDLLVGLARHDPNVHVRASVTQLVVRFAQAGRVPWSLVTERFADAAEVRAALVSQLGVNAPAEARELALRGLADAEEIVRREAFEVCVRLVDARVAEPAVLVEALARMTRGECTNALDVWFAASPADDVLRVLASSSHREREIAIRVRPDLAFDIIGEDVELFTKVERGIVEPVPLRLLLGVVLRDPWRTYDAQELADRCSVGEVPRDMLASLAELRSRYDALLADLVAELESCGDEYEVDELQEQRVAVEKLVATLERLRPIE